MRRTAKDTEGNARKVTRRALFLGGAQLAFIAVLGARMRYMQVDEAEEDRLLAEENRINIRLIHGVVFALGVALALAWAHRGGWLFTWPRSRTLGYLGRISYGVFLLNFPVALVVNAWFTRYASPDAWTQTHGVLVAWLACNLAGAAFHHGVEQRLAGLGRARRPTASLQAVALDAEATGSQRSRK